MIPLLMPHTGRHRRPRPPRHAPWQRARRAFLALLPARRVTPLPDLIELPASTGQLAAVHPRAHLGPERPTTLQRPDGQVVIDEHHHVQLYPWPAAERPGFPAPAEGRRADDTRCDLPVARPYVPAPADREMREEYFRPVYGEAPQDAVDEAQRVIA